METENLLKRFEETIRKESKEHFRTFLVSAINLIQPIGGTLATLFDSYIPNSKQERILRFIRDIAIEVENLKDKLRDDKIETDSFAYIFEKSLRSVSIDYQKDKAEVYKAIILNSLLPNNISDEIKEYYVNLVDTLTPIHIRILKADKIPQEFRDTKLDESNDTVTIEEDQIFHFPLPPFSDQLIMSAWRDLHSRGLVKESKTTAGDGTFGITTIKGELTEFGQNFIDYITMPQ